MVCLMTRQGVFSADAKGAAPVVDICGIQRTAEWQRRVGRPLAVVTFIHHGPTIAQPSRRETSKRCACERLQQMSDGLNGDEGIVFVIAIMQNATALGLTLMPQRPRNSS